MNSITSLIPSPRPVRLSRLGLTVRVAEFTLRDLAELQSVLDAQWVDPLAEFESQATQDEGDRHEGLKAAYAKAEAGPPVYGEPRGRPYFATDEGIAILLWVALRKYQPNLTPEGAAEITQTLTSSEYGQIWRIAHGSNALKSLERLLGLGAVEKAGPDATWGQIIDEVCQSHPGWTYQDVYDMTMTEFINARRMGKPITAGVAIPMDANFNARIAEQRRKWERGK